MVQTEQKINISFAFVCEEEEGRGEGGVTNTMQPHSHPLHWLEGQHMYTATCKQENRGEHWELGAVGAEGAVHHLNS